MPKPRLYKIYEDPAKEIINLLNKLASETKSMCITIIESRTNQIVGSCEFNHLDFEKNKAAIGYELDRLFWAEAMVRKLFLVWLITRFAIYILFELKRKSNPKMFLPLSY